MNELLQIAIKAINEKKGENVIKYTFSSLNPYIDEVIICSASNIRQVYAIAENIKDRIKEHGLCVRAIEGNSASRWILVDLDTVIVHVFLQEERTHFQLEKLYADLPHEDVSA